MSEMPDRTADLESKIADLERRLEKYERPSKPAPAYERYPDGHVTLSAPHHPAILPAADELRRLEEIVYRAYPKLKAGGAPNSFRASFYRLTYTRRADRIDTKRDIGWWVDMAEDWLKAQHYHPSRPADQSFVAADVAMGDIEFSDPDKFPNMRLGITSLPQLEPLPGRWRAVFRCIAASGLVKGPLQGLVIDSCVFPMRGGRNVREERKRWLKLRGTTPI
jgi:hypothetical protein